MPQVVSAIRTISNPFDPNTWAGFVNDRLSEFATMVVNSIMRVLIDPPKVIDSTWAALLFGNVKGLTPALVNLAIVIAMFILILWQRGVSKFLPTLLLAVIVMVGLPTFYWFADQTYEAGNTLTMAMQFGEDIGAEGQQQILPVAVNIVLGFFGFLSLSGLSAGLYLLLLVYAYLDVTALFWLPVLATFYFLFEGARKAVKILVAILIVAMLTGRPVIMFFLSGGRSFAGLINAQDELTQFIVAIIGLMLGFFFQFVMFWLAYKGVSYVESMVQGGKNRSEVHGKVKTEQDTPLKLAQANAFNIHAVGMQSSPKVEAAEGLAAREARKVVVKQRITSASSEVVAAGAAYFGVPYPAARAVTGAGSRKINSGIEKRAVEKSTTRPR